MEEVSQQEQNLTPATPPPPPPPSYSYSSSPSTSNIEQQHLYQHEHGGLAEDQSVRNENPQVGSRFSSFRCASFLSDFRPRALRDDVLAFIAIAATFWFFASMTLILGVYGSMTLQLGPYCSRLIQTNSVFVQSIKVNGLGEHESGVMLYGFHKLPLLDVQLSWSEVRSASISVNSYKDWLFYLNKGSKVDISYSVKSSSLPVSLVIAQGEDSLVDWIDDPSYPNTTLSWNIIYGSGKLQQDIPKSSNYYFAVGNLNTEDVEIQMKFSFKELVYNTTQAYSKCSLGDSSCTLDLRIFSTNAAVLVSRGTNESTSKGNRYVKVSYGPRWIAYILGSGIISIFIWFGFKFCTIMQFENTAGIYTSASDTRPERTPLLPEKDDDSSSWGSSYDSVLHDEADLEELIVAEGKVTIEGEGTNPRQLRCVVCFDAPRDCFFLPCGHCATCFPCGSRIGEDAGTCPICRRKMKKVRKIFTV